MSRFEDHMFCYDKRPTKIRNSRLARKLYDGAITDGNDEWLWVRKEVDIKFIAPFEGMYDITIQGERYMQNMSILLSKGMDIYDYFGFDEKQFGNLISVQIRCMEIK